MQGRFHHSLQGQKSLQSIRLPAHIVKYPSAPVPECSDDMDCQDNWSCPERPMLHEAFQEDKGFLPYSLLLFGFLGFHRKAL